MNATQPVYSLSNSNIIESHLYGAHLPQRYFGVGKSTLWVMKDTKLSEVGLPR